MGGCVSRLEEQQDLSSHHGKALTATDKGKGPAASSAGGSHGRQLSHKSGQADGDAVFDESFRINAGHDDVQEGTALSPSAGGSGECSQVSSRPASAGGSGPSQHDSPAVSRAATHSTGLDRLLSSHASSVHGEVHATPAVATRAFHGSTLKRLKSAAINVSPSSSVANSPSSRAGASVTWAQEVLKDNQVFVLKTTAGGRLMKSIRSGMPEALLVLCQALIALYDLSRAAHYNVEGCKLFLRRAVMLQDLVGEREDLMACVPLHQQLLDVVQDAHDLFAQFSERGWLARLETDAAAEDQADFERIDAQMVAALHDAGAGDLSDTLAAEVATPAAYAPHHQQLAGALSRFGGMAAVQGDAAGAAAALAPFVVMPAASGMLVELLQQEAEHWASDRGAPSDVIRHLALRAEWRRTFGASAERVSWRDFWGKLVSPNARGWALEGRMDKFVPEYLQKLIERGIKGKATLAHLDFAFRPNYSLGATVNAMLALRDPSTNRVNSASSGGRRRSTDNGNTGGPGAGAFGLEPNVRLHNFPEAPSYLASRASEVAELSLSMQDISTNTVVLIGPPGIGKTQLAATLGGELVASGHWSEAYWVDLQGVISQQVAGYQILAALGLYSDQPDPLHVLAWLEERGQERFGIVLAHAQDILGQGGLSDGQGAFLEFVEQMLQAARKLQVVLVAEEQPPHSNYTARTVEVQGLAAVEAKAMLKSAAPAADEGTLSELADACAGSPLALQAATASLRYGHFSPAEFMRLLNDPALPCGPTTNTPTGLIRGLRRDDNSKRGAASAKDSLLRALVVCAVCLPDDLVSALLVLAHVPAPFSYEQAGELMAAPASHVRRRGVLRRLCSLELLQRNAALQQFSMHPAVRDGVLMLATHLGVPYTEAKRRYMEVVLASATAGAAKLQQGGAMLAAHVAWGRLEVAVCQAVQWAYANVTEGMLPLYTQLAWDCGQFLQARMGMAMVQGFMQLCYEKAQVLDHHINAAKLGTQLGSLLSEAGSAKRADQMLRSALEVLWRELKERHPAIGRCYFALGAALLRTGKLQDAASTLQQALDVDEATAGPTGMVLVPALTLLAEARRKQRRFGEAEELCKRAVEIAAAARGEEHPDVAAANVSLAQVARMAGRFSEAEALLQEAAGKLEKALGPDHPRVVAVTVQLGQLAAQQGRQAAAEQLYRKALAACQKVQGPNHPETSACLLQLVGLLRSAGKANDALPLAQRALAIKQRQAGGSPSLDLAAAVQGVAEVMLDLGRYADVEKLCGRAAAIHQQCATKGPTKALIAVWTMQALSLSLLGRAGEAEALANKALEEARKLSGDVSDRQRMVASCHNCHCEALKELGRLQEAEEECLKGLSIREKEFGPEHPAVALSLFTLSTILRARQQLPAALDAIRRCAAIRSKGKGAAVEGPQMAAALQQEALVRLDMGQVEEAAQLAARALDIRQRALGNSHPDVGLSLMGLAEVHMAQGQIGNAEQLLEEALELLQGRLGPTHPSTKRAQQLIADCADPEAAQKRVKVAQLAGSSIKQLTAIQAQLGSGAVAGSAPTTHAGVPLGSVASLRCLSAEEEAVAAAAKAAAAAPAAAVTEPAPAAVAAAETQQQVHTAAAPPRQSSAAEAAQPVEQRVSLGAQLASIGASISASSGSADLRDRLDAHREQQQQQQQQQKEEQQQVQQQQQQTPEAKAAPASRFKPRPASARSVGDRSLNDDADEIREIQEYIRSRGWNISVSQVDMVPGSAPMSTAPSAPAAVQPTAPASAPVTARAHGPPGRHHTFTGVFTRNGSAASSDIAPVTPVSEAPGVAARLPGRMQHSQSMHNIGYAAEVPLRRPFVQYEYPQYSARYEEPRGRYEGPEGGVHGGWSPVMWDHSEAVLNPLYDDGLDHPWPGGMPHYEEPVPYHGRRHSHMYPSAPYELHAEAYGPPPAPQHHYHGLPHGGYHHPGASPYYPPQQPPLPHGYASVPHNLAWPQGSGASEQYSPHAAASSGHHAVFHSWHPPAGDAAWAAAPAQMPLKQQLRQYGHGPSYEPHPSAPHAYQQPQQQQPRMSHASIPTSPFADAAQYGPFQPQHAHLPRTASNGSAHSAVSSRRYGSAELPPVHDPAVHAHSLPRADSEEVGPMPEPAPVGGHGHVHWDPAVVNPSSSSMRPKYPTTSSRPARREDAALAAYAPHDMPHMPGTPRDRAADADAAAGHAPDAAGHDADAPAPTGGMKHSGSFVTALSNLYEEAETSSPDSIAAARATNIQEPPPLAPLTLDHQPPHLVLMHPAAPQQRLAPSPAAASPAVAGSDGYSSRGDGASRAASATPGSSGGERRPSYSNLGPHGIMLGARLPGPAFMDASQEGSPMASQPQSRAASFTSMRSVASAGPPSSHRQASRGPSYSSLPVSPPQPAGPYGGVAGVGYGAPAQQPPHGYHGPSGGNSPRHMQAMPRLAAASAPPQQAAQYGYPQPRRPSGGYVAAAPPSGAWARGYGSSTALAAAWVLDGNGHGSAGSSMQGLEAREASGIAVPSAAQAAHGHLYHHQHAGSGGVPGSPAGSAYSSSATSSKGPLSRGPSDNQEQRVAAAQRELVQEAGAQLLPSYHVSAPSNIMDRAPPQHHYAPGPPPGSSSSHMQQHPIAGAGWGYAQPPPPHYFHQYGHVPPQQPAHGMYGRSGYGWHHGPSRGPPPPARSAGYAAVLGGGYSQGIGGAHGADAADGQSHGEYWARRRSSSWNDLQSAVPEDVPFVPRMRRSRSFDAQ